MSTKNLGFGKDAVVARRLHGGNIRNGARVMFFLTGSPRHRREHCPLCGLSYLSFTYLSLYVMNFIKKYSN